MEKTGGGPSQSISIPCHHAICNKKKIIKNNFKKIKKLAYTLPY